jgi:hypothetical protein
MKYYCLSSLWRCQAANGNSQAQFLLHRPGGRWRQDLRRRKGIRIIAGGGNVCPLKTFIRISFCKVGAIDEQPLVKSS